MKTTILHQLKLTIIVGVSDNWVIGKNGDMPWGRNLKDDLKNFRDLTSGPDKVVAMGRKTFESIGRPLPNRLNVILTRQDDYGAKDCLVVNHQDKVLTLAEDHDVYIIGGSEIYNLFLPYVNRMIVTHVHTTVFKGDTHFPEISPDWRATPLLRFEKNDRNIYDFDIVEYTKKPRP